VTSRDDQKKTASPGRGPSYPIFDLAEAVSRIRKFYDEEGKAAAPPASAVRHWGFSEKSNTVFCARKEVATLVDCLLADWRSTFFYTR
jgi:hypothetical protein